MTLRITPEQQRLASFDGLKAAVDRHAADQGRGLRPAFISMTESLYWAATIDEMLRDEPWYEHARAEHPGGLAMPGIRYARNFATHELVAISETGLAPLGTPTATTTLSLRGMTWVAFEDLPLPRKPNRKYTPAQQQSYRDELVGESTLVTFLRVRAWFQSITDRALP